MLAISPTIQEYVNLKHRCKTDIVAVILESAASGAVTSQKYTTDHF